MLELQEDVTANLHELAQEQRPLEKSLANRECLELNFLMGGPGVGDVVLS